LDDLRRVCSRVVYPTFQLTCRALGLLALGDDKEWSEAFCKAIATTMSPQLVQLFVSVILFCEVIRPLVLFTQFWHSMHDDDDILYKLRTCFRMPTDDHLKDCVLLELEAPINNKQVLFFLKPLTVQRMMSSQGTCDNYSGSLPFGGKSLPHLDQNWR